MGGFCGIFFIKTLKYLTVGSCLDKMKFFSMHQMNPVESFLFVGVNVFFFFCLGQYLWLEKYPSSWGRNFVGIKFEFVINAGQMLVKRSWGCKRMCKGYPRKTRTLVPQEQ